MGEIQRRLRKEEISLMHDHIKRIASQYFVFDRQYISFISDEERIKLFKQIPSDILGESRFNAIIVFRHELIRTEKFASFLNELSDLNYEVLALEGVSINYNFPGYLIRLGVQGQENIEAAIENAIES